MRPSDYTPDGDKSTTELPASIRHVSETWADIPGFVRAQQLPLTLTGLVLLFAGIASIFAPEMMATTLLWLVGLQFTFLGLMTVVQWALGRVQQGPKVHGAIPVSFQAGISLALGAAFLTPGISLRLLLLWVWVGLLAEGVIQLWFAYRLKTRAARIGLTLSGFFSVGVATWAAIAKTLGDTLSTLFFLGGFKLALFGAALLAMARNAARAEDPGVYGATAFGFSRNPRRGEAYAVYIGNSFHLGVYVGGNEVVDFRDDNRVHKVTWPEFLLGRRPVHWEYPDLELAAAEEIVAYAKSEVGKEYKYSLVNFNCESFAITCLTVGRAKTSKFAQIGIAERAMERFPLMATAMNLQLRFAGYVAYLLGGRTGHRLSLFIRQMSGVLTHWMMRTAQSVGASN